MTKVEKEKQGFQPVPRSESSTELKPRSDDSGKYDGMKTKDFLEEFSNIYERLGGGWPRTDEGRSLRQAWENRELEEDDLKYEYEEDGNGFYVCHHCGDSVDSDDVCAYGTEQVCRFCFWGD